MKYIKILFLSLILFSSQSCGIYSLSGISTPAKTFQVNSFRNEAAIVEPGLDRTFTFALQDRIQDQSNLSLTNSNAELIYEGEIVEYFIAPQASTSANQAVQNRITITVNVRYINNLKPDGEEDFERRFSFFSDTPGTALPTGSTLSTAIEEIFERITQDIINESLANW